MSERMYLVIETREFDAIRALARHRLQDDAVAALDEVATKAILVEPSEIGFADDPEGS